MSDNFDKEIKEIFIDEIIPNRFQPRLNFDQKSLVELSDSIKQHGIIQPLILRKLGDKYEIIAGERRYKASQIAGLVKVPAIIVDFDDNKSAEVAIVENLHRKEMTALEEARAFKKLLQKEITQDQLGTRLGKSQSYIANKLRLLSLNETVQEALIKEQISERHARSLLTIKNMDEQINVLNEIINRKLTVKETDDIIREKFGEVIIEELPVANIVVTQPTETVVEPIKNEIEAVVQQQNIITDLQQPQPVAVDNNLVTNMSNENEANNIINFNLNDLKKEEEKVNAPKPFVLIDQANNLQAFDISDTKAEPHNNVESNPQKELINKLGNINTNSDELLFKDTSAIRTSPYVIPKTDIKENYLVPGSIIEPIKPITNEPTVKTENTNSFNIESIIKPNVVEEKPIEDNKKEIPGGFNIEQLLRPDVVEEKSSPETISQEEKPQNRFIVEIKDQKEEFGNDIGKAKEMIKKNVETLKASGVRIEFEEFDFERLYQIIIKIEK